MGQVLRRVLGRWAGGAAACENLHTAAHAGQERPGPAVERLANEGGLGQALFVGIAGLKIRLAGPRQGRIVAGGGSALSERSL